MRKQLKVVIAMTKQKPKHEYEVLITVTEVHSVFVEAEDYEAAEEMAEEKYYNGEAEWQHSDVDVKVNWSDEED